MDKLKELYYNPSIGYVSFNTFWDVIKNNDITITREDAKKFYDNQQVNQIYRIPKKKFINIKCPFGIGCLQLDLMDINRFQKDNKQYRWLLNVVDVYSRYAWSFPLKSKDSKEIANIIDALVNHIRILHPKNTFTFTTDNGKEFVNSNFQKLVDKYDFIYDHYITTTSLSKHPGQTSIVESFNRTLWNFIKKYTAANNTLTFIDVLPQFITNYNHKIHSSTKMTPVSIIIHNSSPDIINDKYEPELYIGDYVRVLLNEKNFSKKSFQPKFSIPIYEIVDRNGNRFELKNIKTGQYLKNDYLERELLKVDNDVENNEYDKTLLKNKKYNRYNRLQSKEPAFKKSSNIENINDGNVIIAKKLIPKDVKRKSKQTDFYQ